MAAVRQVFNPIEKDDVIGITNYIDVGLQLNVPLAAAEAAAAAGKGTAAAAAAGGSSSSSGSAEASGAAGLRLAGAWQVGWGGGHCVTVPVACYTAVGGRRVLGWSVGGV